MTRITTAAIFLFSTCFYTHAFADNCFILYKAKKDDPLRLHVGLMEIEQKCTNADLEVLAEQRLRSDGWLLLKIVDRLQRTDTKKIESDLGEFFLKY